MLSFSWGHVQRLFHTVSRPSKAVWKHTLQCNNEFKSLGQIEHIYGFHNIPVRQAVPHWFHKHNGTSAKLKKYCSCELFRQLLLEMHHKRAQSGFQLPREKEKLIKRDCTSCSHLSSCISAFFFLQHPRCTHSEKPVPINKEVVRPLIRAWLLRVVPARETTGCRENLRAPLPHRRKPVLISSQVSPCTDTSGNINLT